MTFIVLSLPPKAERLRSVKSSKIAFFINRLVEVYRYLACVVGSRAYEQLIRPGACLHLSRLGIEESESVGTEIETDVFRLPFLQMDAPEGAERFVELTVVGTLYVDLHHLIAVAVA